MNPYQVIKDFESALCEYTGAPYVVCVNSCTNALLLAIKWFAGKYIVNIEIPARTYCSVPMVIKQQHHIVTFRYEEWRGVYQLRPSFVWDCACRFTSGMYVSRQYQCVSFAANKILGIEQGGAILHEDIQADKWFRKMRFDGRTEGKSILEDTYDLIGLHCPMLPSIAAQGILRLHHLPKYNEDLVFDYPDLSQHPAFK